MKLVAWAIVSVLLLPAVATSQQSFVGQQDAAAPSRRHPPKNHR